jgi:hypothetical protein
VDKWLNNSARRNAIVAVVLGVKDFPAFGGASHQQCDNVSWALFVNYIVHQRTILTTLT